MSCELLGPSFKQCGETGTIDYFGGVSLLKVIMFEAVWRKELDLRITGAVDIPPFRRFQIATVHPQWFLWTLQPPAPRCARCVELMMMCLLQDMKQKLSTESWWKNMPAKKQVDIGIKWYLNDIYEKLPSVQVYIGALDLIDDSSTMLTFENASSPCLCIFCRMLVQLQVDLW